jgi:tetratricopeptide (TPR) repeat protein
VSGPDDPLLQTAISGQAHVEKLLNVARVENLHVGDRAAPQALFQLEADIPDFVGREELLAELGALLEQVGSAGAGVGARLALYGPPGVGKSALAVRLAHAAKPAFPDAQLYVNLGAGAGSPLAPGEVLAGFLRALGVEGPFPESVDERAAFFRSQLEGRRALVVLDNARDVAHVRPLLPGSPTCAVILTSRRPLGGLAGAAVRKVEVLDSDVAVQLLGEIVGAPRVEDEREAAVSVARLCGELPLALRIAAGRLRNRPHRTLAWLAERLSDERERLGELELDDQAVRASLTISYEELEGDAARLFCLLAELPGPDFSTALAAGAAELETREAERLLDCLLEAQMLEPAGPERYRFHDLIRLFASERLEAEPDLDRALIRTRATLWLIDGAAVAGGALESEDAAHTTALEWLEAERRSLIATVEAAGAASKHFAVLALTIALSDFFALRSHWDDWTGTHELALRSARALGERKIECQLLNSLATAYIEQGYWRGAILHFERARALAEELGHRDSAATVLNNLANVYLQQGHTEKAIANHEQALAICRELKAHRREAETLGTLANVYFAQGHTEEAITNDKQALAIYRELKDRRGEAIALYNLAGAQVGQGSLREAVANYERVLTMHRKLGDRRREALVLRNLGIAMHELGDVAAGEQRMREAYELLEALGAPEAEGMRDLLTADEVEPPAR